MSFTNISGALDNHLKTMLELPPVAWPNVQYKPISGTAYIRPTLLPATTLVSSIGNEGKDYSKGIYQIDIFTESGEGKKESQDLADLIGNRFSHGTQILYNGVTVEIETTSVTPAINNENGRYRVMIELVYFSFTSRR